MISGQCIACNGKLSKFSIYKFKSKIFKKVYGSKYLFKCDDCDTVQADCSQIDNTLLDIYYADHYRQSAGIGGNNNANEDALYKARGFALAQMIADRRTGPISVYEIGAGLGFNLIAVKEAIPDSVVYATEPDENTIWPEYFHLDDPSVSFDFIIISHVLEHVTHPLDFLRDLSSRLKSGGSIIIEVPNEKSPSLDEQLFYEPHVLFFDRKTLKSLLVKTDLKIVDLFDAGPPVRRLTWKNKIAVILPTWLKDKMRSGGVAPEPDFTARDTNGIYLRAILEKP